VTTYNLFGSSIPTLQAGYKGSFMAGIVFQVTQGGMWLDAYRWRLPSGGDTGSQKFALWNLTGASQGDAQLISGSVENSGTMNAGQVNTIPLAAPVQLAIGTPYLACTGWTVNNGFPANNFTFNSSGTDPNGITSGPLFAYADSTAGGSPGVPYIGTQGQFAVSQGIDTSVSYPIGSSNSADFGMDVLVDTAAPAGFTGPYSLWPNNYNANAQTVADTAAIYKVGPEIDLAQSCTVSQIRYYSPPGVTQLATVADVWQITGGGLTGTQLWTNTSPTWSGAAGSGWISTAVPNIVVSGKIKLSAGCSVAAACFAKDASTDYFRNGAGGSGITNGPITAPNLSSSQLAYNFNGNEGGSPAYSDGTTLAGQCTFAQGPPDITSVYPYLVALVSTPTTGSTQNYWVDGMFSLYTPPAMMYVMRTFP
jgi:hypothetical protein